jgi:hypothetical protein
VSVVFDNCDATTPHYYNIHCRRVEVPFSDVGPNNSTAAGRYGRADITAKMCRPQSMFSIACPLSNIKSINEPLRFGLPRVRLLETRPILAYDAPGEWQCLKSWIRTKLHDTLRFGSLMTYLKLIPASHPRASASRLTICSRSLGMHSSITTRLLVVGGTPAELYASRV